MVVPPLPSDSLILVSWPRPEGHFSIFSAIQAFLSCTFHLAVYSLGLRRSGSWSRIINQAQHVLEQASWDGNLGQLEDDVAAMAYDLRADFHRLLMKRVQ